MTKVTYDEDNFCLTMEGHAGAAPAGEDLVCAALSMLMFTLQAAVQDHIEILMPSVYQADGAMSVRCSPAPRQKKTCRTLYRTIFAGWELLGKQYPEYGQVIQTEQEGM